MGNKHLHNQLRSEAQVIAEHRKKIVEELTKPYPSRQDIAKWQGDIARHERIKARLEAKLLGRKR